MVFVRNVAQAIGLPAQFAVTGRMPVLLFMDSNLRYGRDVERF